MQSLIALPILAYDNLTKFKTTTPTATKKMRFILQIENCFGTRAIEIFQSIFQIDVNSSFLVFTLNVIDAKQRAAKKSSKAWCMICRHAIGIIFANNSYVIIYYWNVLLLLLFCFFCAEGKHICKTHLIHLTFKWFYFILYFFFSSVRIYIYHIYLFSLNTAAAPTAPPVIYWLWAQCFLMQETKSHWHHHHHQHHLYTQLFWLSLLIRLFFISSFNSLEINQKPYNWRWVM